jgi:hypothetical protein
VYGVIALAMSRRLNDQPSSRDWLIVRNVGWQCEAARPSKGEFLAD